MSVSSELGLVVLAYIIALPLVARLFPNRPRLTGRAFDVVLGVLLLLFVSSVLLAIFMIATFISAGEPNL